MESTTATNPQLLHAMAVTGLWNEAATAMDALHELQRSPLWAALPLATRRHLCAARCHCEALIDGIDAIDAEGEED